MIFKFERDQVLVERDFLITSLHMYHSQHYIIFVYNCKNDVCSWWRLELSSKCPWLKLIVEEKHAANFKTAFIFVSVEWCFIKWVDISVQSLVTNCTVTCHWTESCKNEM